ncbi:trypsin-like [Chrysoperla carnea]|uniref:trypsin-like n=1 Tax=Chrysoperla carnea TaxID=189513 RepID=UPI001D08F82B|nr:trypsin-like [Chrysoperla carnea]
MLIKIFIVHLVFLWFLTCVPALDSRSEFKINDKFKNHGQFHNLFPLIMGGEKARIEEFPFVVQLAHWQNFGWFYKCVGIILETRIILTAAHCIPETNSYYYKRLGIEILAGTKDLLNWREAKRKGAFRNIKKKHIRIHPLYNRTGYDYDVALLKIGPQILPFSEKIGSIEIGTTDWESQSNDTTIHKGTVVGWGYFKPYELSPVLKKLDLEILPKNACLKEWGEVKDLEYLDRKFCAIFKKNLTNSACAGDSGGPFIVYGKLYGVVSSGKSNECEDTTRKSIQVTRLTHTKIATWIHETKKELLKDY